MAVVSVCLTKTKKFSVLSLRPEKSSAYVWFSSRLKEALSDECSNNITFDGNVRIAIEEDIEKARRTRERKLEDDKIRGYILPMDIGFTSLKIEQDFCFDTKKYPFQEAFLEMLGLSDIVADISRLHENYMGDVGRKKDREEKQKLLSGIIDPNRREKFHRIFDLFVRQVIAPQIRAQMPKCDHVYYQTFPCVRVVRPQEFSIGPHADISYGFSQANINYYLPLNTIFGTNSLVIESAPGREDWHTINLSYGSYKKFYGVLCTHFTPENTTSYTRVSLDFRVIPGEYWHDEHDHFTRTRGYYAHCRYSEETPNSWESIDLPSPDWRVGFPFVQ